MEETTDPHAYAERLRVWQAAVAEWLGWRPDEVLQIEDEGREFGSLEIRWTAIAKQSAPRFGVDQPRGFDVNDERNLFTGGVWLDPGEAAALLAAVGAKPRAMSVEDELRLRGIR